MRDWKVPFTPGYHLSLAADARFCNPSFCNDQIWELAWDGSSNPGINIQTTYGLRVRKARLFPRFIRNGKQLSDPNSFFSPLLLRKFAPNYVLLTCSPYSGIEVQLEYWVPESQVITGRISFTNKNPDTESIALEWVGTLNPLGDGESMMVYPLGPGHVLTGRSGKLCPVCYLTGSPSPTQNTSPALSVALELEAGQTRRLTWAMAGLETIEKSFNLARAITARQWDAEIARLEVQNTRHTVEIYTGDPDWDLALTLSQKEAFGLYHRAVDEPDCPVLLLNRVPDQGYSARGDGKDCDTNWNGVTPLDLHYWMQLILPGAPEIAAIAIGHILHHAQADGFIDLKSNTNGQKTHLLSQPLLVTLCSQIENVDSQSKLRQDYFLELMQFLKLWFSPDHDRDQDGLPEWDRVEQTGIESAPIFDERFINSPSYSIHQIETPALAAMLFNECTLLLESAQLLKDEPAINWLSQKISRLSEIMQSNSTPENAKPFYRDYQTHFSPTGTRLGILTGNGKIVCMRELPIPGRPVITIRTEDGKRKPITVLIKGKIFNCRKGSEKVSPESFSWHNGRGQAIAENAFSSIEHATIKGASNLDRIQVTTMDFAAEDISLYLPLWAKMLPESFAKKQIDTWFLPRYLREFGIPLTSPDNIQPDGPPSFHALLPWVVLIGQGLLNYHYRVQAAEILTRILNTIVIQLKKNLQFGEYYDTETGQALGKTNALSGLAPVGFFLNVAGIQNLGERMVIINGNNPFPWPVTVKYKGMTITRKSEDTEILFPSGEVISVKGPGPHHVSLR